MDGIDTYLEVDFCKTISYEVERGVPVKREKDDTHKLLIFESDDVNNLLNISQIRSGYLIGKIIRDKGFVRYLGSASHVDPCIPFFDNLTDRYRLEFVLYGQGIENEAYVHVSFLDNMREPFSGKVNFRTINSNKDEFGTVLGSHPASQITFLKGRSPKLYINANGLDVNVILQSEKSGVFSERNIFSKKEQESIALEIPPAWAEHYGIAVAFEHCNAFNIEHKHIIQGHFCTESSVIHYKNGEFRRNGLFPYASLVANVQNKEDIDSCAEFEYHEATLFADKGIYKECIERFGDCKKTLIIQN